LRPSALVSVICIGLEACFVGGRSDPCRDAVTAYSSVAA
jgi:hypothetical protein